VRCRGRGRCNLRLGGEVRFNPLYLRAGYAFYGSPYRRVDPNADESRNVFSAGLGIRTRSAFVDFAYAKGITDQAYYMYRSQVTNGSINKSEINNLILTVGFRF
jgi:hypothetical protein